MVERRPSIRHRFPRLLTEYERDLRRRVQQGEIKEATLNNYLNDAGRVFEGLLFATGPSDIDKAVKEYGYRGYYRKVIRDLRQIVQQRRIE